MFNLAPQTDIQNKFKDTDMNNIPPFQQKKIIYAYTSKLSHNKHSSKVNKLHKSQNFIQNDTI